MRQRTVGHPEAHAESPTGIGGRQLLDQHLEHLASRPADEPSEDIKPYSRGQEKQDKQDHRPVGPGARQKILAARRQEILSDFLAIQRSKGYQIEEEQDQVDEDELEEQTRGRWQDLAGWRERIEQAGTEGEACQDGHEQGGERTGGQD